MRVTALAPVDYATGYGIDACQKLLGLIRLGHTVFVRASKFSDSPEGPVPYPVQERLIHAPTSDEWELLIQPPWFCPTPGKKTVFCTTLETTRPKPEYIENLNRARAVVVPSMWNRNSLKQAGLKTEVWWCPQSVDEVYRYRKPRARKKFVFGTAGNVKQNGRTRKNLGMVINAFLNAFEGNDDVRLRIKTDLPVLVNDERIEVWHHKLSPRELSDWYASLDTFVSVSHGEAWGRMVHEAMAVGRPVITPNYGGVRELFADVSGYAVEYKVVPASGEYKGMGEWCEPEWDDLVWKMRLAYAERHTLAEKGKAASQVVSDYSVDGCGGIFESVLVAAGMLEFKEEQPQEPPIIWTPEERILNFYREMEPVPKLPVPESFKSKNLTNTPEGIGDTMILTPFHAPVGNTKIFSKSDSFASLVYFHPYYDDWLPRDLICADRLQKRYAMGNGHFIQRLSRVFDKPVELKPKGFLEVLGIEKVKNRVAVHLLPGGHSDWQRRYIHPRAREMYDRSVKILQDFVRKNGQYGWYEVGSRRSTWIDEAHDMTGIGLCETVRFLKTCEWFVGIISGPMHIATALDCKCIVIVNFPAADRIFLPTLKDIPQVESEWFYPQNVHLHQEGNGPLVKRFTGDNLKRAFDGEIYPYWSDRFLPLIHEKL